MAGNFRDLDRLLAVFALVLKLVVLALLLRPAFVGPVFLGLVQAFAFFRSGSSLDCAVSTPNELAGGAAVSRLLGCYYRCQCRCGY